ncbi:SdiA-regulated domain-containing protein [uncultured Pseudomonas sp.]|uniref:SdiA-regulated domain-containing protein n=1 Tax=uncultured Pseudomonas sp. TaxID=114707 RepID=UPI0025883ED0|nr:SdiA-regulated domain-containing protein [uncultured Pseudomonas sp.]
MTAWVRRIRIGRTGWLLALALLLALGVTQGLRSSHLDSQLLFWLGQQWQSEPRTSLELGRYRVAVEAKPVAGVTENLSDLSYDPERDRLWAVVNNPPELLALSRDGELLQRHRLEGFDDVEGVTYLGNDRLLLAEEGANALTLVGIPEGDDVLRRKDYRSLTLDLFPRANQGFEGLDYDAARDRLFVVKEHSPRKLYEIRGVLRSFDGDFALRIIDRQAWLDQAPSTGDLSAVHVDRRTGHLLLLSDESRVLIELDDQGHTLDTRSLVAPFGGLSRRIRQPEGVTLDTAGNLYVVSEPNLFYRYQKR